MAAERYLSRRIPDSCVGNDIDKIDKKPVPSIYVPVASENLNQYINFTAFDLVSTVCRCLCPIKGRYFCLG